VSAQLELTKPEPKTVLNNRKAVQPAECLSSQRAVTLCRMTALCFMPHNLPLFEIARVLVRLDHFARRIAGVSMAS